ncbi:hypothetical protein AVEN_178817-1 [Araneus ventricosus]|uniref:Uncharacterized protein n=1 Tax=Araneus ventricosus TaxID=182803 RepID=A0A4Y2BEH4_ARAVE|nr:hypothetical protein AVEN_178817-1 [Araneus ventricosus]
MFGVDLVILNLGQITRMIPEPALPLQAPVPHQREEIWPPANLARVRPTYTTFLRWNRVSNLGPSSPKSKTLQTGHLGPKKLRGEHSMTL